MKLTIALFAVGIAVVMAAVDKSCHDGTDCTCKHPDEVPNCENHICTCVATGVGKREVHTCTSDADCATYDCHGHGTPSCSHHGSTEHGHDLCACVV